jgi:hypothetical protein
MLSRLQNLAIQWLPFLEKHSWQFPQKLNNEECFVYGTGYESWGLWAHLNGNLFLAESLSWDEKIFENDSTKFKNFETRKKIAVGMFRYALAYHTTGDFVGAGGTRWGGEPSDGQGKEGYNNWHSPLWVAFLAEVYFTLEKFLTPDLKERFLKVVLHDADIQTQLNISSFDGEAEENTKASHPESNAWKACLLLLARQLSPAQPNVKTWQNLENRLWVSSFAAPNDTQNETNINGQAIKDLAIGNHITNTFNVVHHGFLHPCYMIFPLLSRLQAARFSQRFNLEYPKEAAFREEEVLARLTPFLMDGRVIYPAGQDWPRWSYGQFYLLPILLYRNCFLGQNYSTEIEGLIKTRETDLADSHDHSFVIHRYGDLLKNSAWEAHRFESDAASSLIQAIQILKSENKSSKVQQKKEADVICYEPLAKTVYLKRSQSFFGVSARAFDGPAQLTIVSKKNPHLLEWRNNGNPQLSRLHGIGELKKDFIEQDRFKLIGNDSFAAFYQIIHSKEGFKLPSFKMTINAGVLPKKELILVRQKAISQCFTAASKIQMHVWKFTQSPHNHWARKITFNNGEFNLTSDIVTEQTINSPWVCVDGELCLTLPKNQSFQTWHLSQGSHHEDKTGITWFELSVMVPIDPQERIEPGRIFGDSAIIASLSNHPIDAEVILKDHSTIFNLGSVDSWELSETPNLIKQDLAQRH